MRATIVTPAQAPASVGCRPQARPAAVQAPRRRVSMRAVEAPGAEVPPLSDEVAAKLAELGIDFERSGLKYLPNEARVGAGSARSEPPSELPRMRHRARALNTAAGRSTHGPLLASDCRCGPWTASQPSLRRPRTRSAAVTCGRTSPSWPSSSGEGA